MSLARRLIWLLAVGFLAVACNDVAEKDTAPLELTIADLQDQVVEGVQVCEGDTDNCALSDSNGQVTLQVPFGQEIFYTISKEGYYSGVFAEVVTENGLRATQGIQTDSETAPFFEELMSAYPQRGTGAVQIFMLPAFAGATFGLIDATGKRFYDHPRGRPDLQVRGGLQ